MVGIFYINNNKIENDMKLRNYLNKISVLDEIPNNNMLSEAGFSRVLSKMRNRDFAVISAFRNKYTKKQNIQRNKELRSVFSSMKMGVYPLIGHWQKCQDEEIPYEKCPKEMLVDVIERSFLVVRPETMSIEEFKTLIQKLNVRFQQDGSIFSIDGKLSILDKNGKIDKIGDKITLNKISQVYSQYIKKKNIPFVFESEIPGSNSGRMLFNKEQLLYPICSKEEMRDW